MELYHYLTLEAFVDAWGKPSSGEAFTLSAFNLMHAVPEEEYQHGLNQLRKAIRRYEKKNEIPESKSKKDIPFFRDHSRSLVGPETDIFMLSLYESRTIEEQSELSEEPVLVLTLDQAALAEYCLSENLFLLRCKYDKEEAVRLFMEQLKQEYDKFFFDEEHTGFRADSQLFSMLCSACLEQRPGNYARQQEWRLAALKAPEEASYFYSGGDLFPYVPLSLPPACIRKITLLNYEEMPLQFGALAGFLKKIGLAPDKYLTGRIE